MTTNGSGHPRFFLAILQVVILLVAMHLFDIRSVSRSLPSFPKYSIKNATNTSHDEETLSAFLDTYPDCRNKASTLQEWHAVGFDVTKQVCGALPEWNRVVKQYGEGPSVLGQGTCERYRNRLSLAGASPMPKIVGLPNSPVDMLAHLLGVAGVVSSAGSESEGQLDPWGAQVPLSSAKQSNNYKESIFPIVIVSDPFRFMQRLCDDPGLVQWNKGKQGRCPNLIPYGTERTAKFEATFPVKVFQPGEENMTSTWTNHKTIADFWASWVEGWLKAEIPRLIVRSEDLLLFPEQVARIIAQCFDTAYGSSLSRPLASSIDVDRLKEYAGTERNLSSLTKPEQMYMRGVLKPSIMLALHYPTGETEATLPMATKFRPNWHRDKYHQRYKGGYLRPELLPRRNANKLVHNNTPLPKCEDIVAFVARNPSCDDKIPMIHELASAGVCPEPAFCDQLPSWQQVVDLYGDKPVVLGLDTCEAYRTMIGDDLPMPKLTALWNSGSTALSKTFLHNMMYYNENWNIDRATVTWGKHTPLYLKYKNTYPIRNSDNRDKLLVVTLVRDPLRWMVSMCHSSYGARWKTVDGRCPNLFPTASERAELGLGDGVRTFEVIHTNHQARFRYRTPYESVAQMWSSWYMDYLNATFPRLFVRMEDMLFFPEQVMRIIGNCSGMPIRDKFHYVSERGKDGSNTDLMTAMIKYGTTEGRTPSSLTLEEKNYLLTALDPTLMQLLHYPPLSMNNERR